MFNRRIDEDLAARREIIRDAVNEARVPGPQQSRGGGAGLYGSFESPLVDAPEDGGEDAPHHGESGVDGDGNRFYPFILGIDTPADEAAYVVTGYAVRNYFR